MDSLGDRMKRYEETSRGLLTPRTPVIVRVDGRAFHTFTRTMPAFYLPLRDAMIEASKAVIAEMQGFEVAYHQSDEVSFLLTDYQDISTQNWFDYVTQKIVSIAASVMSANFNQSIRKLSDLYLNRLAYFDARVFNIPKEDVTNYFVWRAKDWERNSLNMYCMGFFSSKQLHGKKAAERHEMLHKIGKNWTTDVTPMYRNGSFILKDCYNCHRVIDTVQARYTEIAAFIEPLVHKSEIKVPTDIDSLLARMQTWKLTPEEYAKLDEGISESA